MHFDVKDTSYRQVADYALREDTALDVSLKELIELGWLAYQEAQSEGNNQPINLDTLASKLEAVESHVDALLEKLEVTRL